MKGYLFVFLLFSFFNCFGATIDVCPSCSERSVSSAIAKAGAGDTIIVNGGNYAEGNILVERPMVILGKNFPVLDGKKQVEILSVKSSGVKISGFEFRNSGKSDLSDFAAVKIYDAKNVEISGNKVINCFFGIYLSRSSFCKVKNNMVSGNAVNQYSSANGIHLWQCSNISISGNTVSGHRDGIYFEFVTESSVTGNTSEGNLRYGLHFMFSDDDIYRGNVFRNNGAGVAVMYTNRVKMIDNRFELNWGPAAYAILLKEIRDSEITGNEFFRNTCAIFAENSNRIKIEKNDFINNGWALKLTSNCEDASITENNFVSNTFDLATNGSGVFNQINRNFWDRYEGFDFDHNGEGDVAYRPVTLSSMIIERIPESLMFLHSFIFLLLDESEKVFPQVIPDELMDNRPKLRRLT